MDIEEEAVQAKYIENIFNKLVKENFPIFEKQIVIQVQEALRIPNRQE
jgi:hypothetical protein